MQPVPDSEPWRVVVAPLAGDRSLRGMPAMKRLTAPQREALLARATISTYRRGEVVYRPGGHGRSLYLVLGGIARVSIPAPNGRRILIHLLPAGEIFGHTALVEGGGQRIFEVSAYTDLRVGRVSCDEFFQVMIGRRAGEVRSLVSFLTERWILLVQRLARFLAQDLRARVAASLIEMARGFGVEDARGHVLSIRITQDVLADLSAGSVRKVSAVLRAFERGGLMRREHGRIVLTDLGALEVMALEAPERTRETH
jgi:CRP-like cAMP-binding protein